MTPELIPPEIEQIPLIKGTRIKVLDIGIEFDYLGMSPDEIVHAHPRLTLAQVHTALAYFYEHIAEMQQKIREDKEYVEKLKKEYPPKALMIVQ